MSSETYVDVPALTARLTLIGVPCGPCPLWRKVLNNASMFGILSLQSDTTATLLTHGVPYNKLPLLIGVHHILDKLIGRILNKDTENIKPLSCQNLDAIRSTYEIAIIDASEKDIQALGVKGDDPAIGFNRWLIEVPTIGYGRSHPDPKALWLSKDPQERMSHYGLRDPDYRPWRLQKAKELSKHL